MIEIIDKIKPPSFYADLTWEITAKRDGKKYLVLVGDGEIDNVQQVVERQIENLLSITKKKG